MQTDVTRNIAARPPAIFAVVSDVAHWPEIFGAVKNIELLTDGPVRAGTRLRENRIMFGHKATEEMEVTTFKRPHEFRLALDNRGMHWEREYIIDALASGGSRVMLIFRSKSQGGVGRTMQPLMTPLMQIVLRDEMENDLADLAAAVSSRMSVTRRSKQ
jgi:polyketide cyclase/dehydrase/lipid transport protein